MVNVVGNICEFPYKSAGEKGSSVVSTGGQVRDRRSIATGEGGTLIFNNKTHFFHHYIHAETNRCCVKSTTGPIWLRNKAQGVRLNQESSSFD